MPHKGRKDGSVSGHELEHLQGFGEMSVKPDLMVPHATLEKAGHAIGGYKLPHELAMEAGQHESGGKHHGGHHHHRKK